MPEATVVPDAKDILHLMVTAWGLKADSVIAVRVGTANCRIVGAGGQRYFLKEFQSAASYAQVDQEMGIVGHLHRDGVAVGRIMPTLGGEGATIYRSRVFQLQSFVAGRMHQKFVAPGWLSRELPRTLAAIMRSLERYPRLPARHLSWFERDLHDRALLFQAFSSRAEQAGWLTVEERRRMAESAMRRAHLIRAVARSGVPEGPFTLANTHGDYSVLQAICSDSSILAVVDFARASYLPVVWEVFRSFSYLDAGCRNGGIDLKALREYVAEFEELVPLSEHDKAHMVDVCAYQLAPGTIGFREALDGESPDKKSFIDFACWRTDMCDTLISRRDELVEMLLR
jgi:Ser/Thr protein kinase RdoA (MazF antagonist)